MDRKPKKKRNVLNTTVSVSKQGEFVSSWIDWRYARSLPVATSLKTPERRCILMAGCLNVTEQPMRLDAGSTVGTFKVVESDQADDCLQGVECKEGEAEFISNGGDNVPEK